MHCRKSAALLFALLLIAVVAFGASTKPTVKSLGDSLICQCGCNQTVNECNHLECASQAEMRAMAAKEIGEGKDETTILQDFVLRYGVKVLASPPTKGFNVTVWILPGVGLLAGLAFVVFLVRRWRHPALGAAAPATPMTIDPKVLAAMEAEMKKAERS
jgi:cytochrome c-type biogenesis protein CcmH